MGIVSFEDPFEFACEDMCRRVEPASGEGSFRQKSCHVLEVLEVVPVPVEGILFVLGLWYEHPCVVLGVDGRELEDCDVASDVEEPHGRPDKRVTLADDVIDLYLCGDAVGEFSYGASVVFDGYFKESYVVF